METFKNNNNKRFKKINAIMAYKYKKSLSWPCAQTESKMLLKLQFKCKIKTHILDYLLAFAEFISIVIFISGLI